MHYYGDILIMNKQAGLTLIELMLALTLGLLVSASAILMLWTGQKSFSMQQGLANLQDNANFGLNYVTKDIRLANLNTQKSEINDQTAFGGIVLTSSVNAKKDTGVNPAIALSNLNKSIVGDTAVVNLLSRSHGHAIGASTQWTGASNVNDATAKSAIHSDQLVIQYIPQYILDDKGTPSQEDDELVGGFDCEGNDLNFPVIKKARSNVFGEQVIVQRYFLRANHQQVNEPNSGLGLACDAGLYARNGDPTAISHYGGGGEVIMPRVDHFRVLLSIQTLTNTRRYISIKDYMDLVDPKPRIVALQIGVLARSLDHVGRDSVIKDDQTYKVLDQNVVVKTDQNIHNKYLRKVITQNVALRNALGERGR